MMNMFKQNVVQNQIMNFKTKANNMFKIVSRYVYTDIFEVIDSADCYDEALRLKYEYQLAFHNAYTIEIVEE